MTHEITWIVVLLLGSVISGLPLSSDETKYKEAKKQYAFSYGIKDDYRGTYFERKEKSDGSTVVGSYSVQLPDGRKQTVKYEADHEKGFVADVSYHGEAQYPPLSKEPPFVVRVLLPEMINNLYHPFIPDSLSEEEQLKQPIPKPTDEDEESSQSVEAPESTEVVHDELRRQEHLIRPKPVFEYHSVPVSEEETHLNGFSGHIGYQHPGIRFQQKPLLSEDNPTFHHSASPLDNQIVQKSNSEIGEESEEVQDFLGEEITGLKSFPSGIGSTYRGIPLPLLSKNPFQLETPGSNLFIPRYSPTMVSKPKFSLSMLDEETPFKYGSVKIGHSLYPLRLRGTLPQPNFLQSSPFIIRPREHNSEDEETIHSDEQRLEDDYDDAFHRDYFHFFADDTQPQTSISHPQNPAANQAPPVYVPAELEKPISHEETLHQSAHFHKDDEELNFKENSSISKEV